MLSIQKRPDEPGFIVDHLTIFDNKILTLNYGTHDFSRLMLALAEDEIALNAGRFVNFQVDMLEHVADIPAEHGPAIFLPRMVDWASKQGCKWSFRAPEDASMFCRAQFSFEHLTPAVMFMMTFA